MHSTKRFLLKKGLGLTCVTNTQCKTSCLSAMFQLPLNSEGRSLSALLPYVLRVSCRDFPGQQAVAAQLDELYGARVEPIIRKRGEAQLIGFAADVIDEHFAMRGDTGLFANTAQMMARILLHPGEFTAENVAREAAQLCARIAALPDDKRTWAVRRMYQHLCDEEAFRLVELGDIEEIRRATPEQLAEQYQKILQTAPLELFYCGSLDADQAAQQLAQAFAERPEIDQLITPKTQVLRVPKHEQLRYITEEEPVAQGKLTIGLRTGITANDPEYPAMIVFNSCFGGSTASRLFCHVREKMSLCYYASSQTEKTKGVMAVTSGIENDSEEQARTEILRQLADIQAGGLTQEEVDNAKRSICASLHTMFDSPFALENFYQTQALLGITETLEQLIARIEAVTIEQVTAAANKAVPDTVYFLKGVGA